MDTLNWGGDHDIEEDQTYLFGEYSIVTNLTCPNCDSYVLVYYQGKKRMTTNCIRDMTEDEENDQLKGNRSTMTAVNSSNETNTPTLPIRGLCKQ